MSDAAKKEERARISTVREDLRDALPNPKSVLLLVGIRVEQRNGDKYFHAIFNEELVSSLSPLLQAALVEALQAAAEWVSNRIPVQS